MVRRLASLVCVAVMLATVPASAATAPRGRSVRTQAALDATLMDRAAPVQVLTRLCANPSGIKECEPLSARMRAALDDAIAAPITWVDHRRVHGPRFLVFAPVVIVHDQAQAELAWRDPGRWGCYGGVASQFRRDHGVWVAYSGFGWAGCSAGP